jgi:hypothetical protein
MGGSTLFDREAHRCSQGREDAQDCIQSGVLHAVFDFRYLCFSDAYHITQLFLRELSLQTYVPDGVAEQVHAEFVFEHLSLACSACTHMLVDERFKRGGA